MTEDKKAQLRAEARYEALMITLGAIITASPNRDTVKIRIGEALHARPVRNENDQFRQSCIAECLDMLFPADLPR